MLADLRQYFANDRCDSSAVAVRRVRQARDAFVAMLEENVERGLVRLSHAKELLGDDPRWRVREGIRAGPFNCVDLLAANRR